jgi:hypothetical protein
MGEEGSSLFVSSVDIKEFRGIEHCKTPLSLSQFTVLIGRNNSGKSSVLEALSILPLPVGSLDYTGENRLNFVEKLHGGRSSLVYAYSGKASLNFKVEDKMWAIRIDDDANVNSSIEIDGVSSSNVLSLVADALDIDKQTDYPSRINDKVFFIPADSAFINSLFSRLQGSEKYRNLIIKIGANSRVAREIINKCVDDRYSETFFAPELSARKERGEGKSPLYVRIKDLGDGIEKAVLVALWLEAINPSLVLWDDFEGSAHPTLIKVLLEWLSKKPWQVVMSTHSFDVLNSLLDVRPKDTKVIMLKKTNDDVLLHEDLTIEQLEDIVETSQDPRRLVDALKL